MTRTPRPHPCDIFKTGTYCCCVPSWPKLRATPFSASAPDAPTLLVMLVGSVFFFFAFSHPPSLLNLFASSHLHTKSPCLRKHQNVQYIIPRSTFIMFNHDRRPRYFRAPLYGRICRQGFLPNSLLSCPHRNEHFPPSFQISSPALIGLQSRWAIFQRIIHSDAAIATNRQYSDYTSSVC